MAPGRTLRVNTTLNPWSGCLCRFDAGTTTWTSLMKFPSSGTAYPQAYFFEHGMRPIVEIMFADFLTIAMDQIVNSAAKMRWALVAARLNISSMCAICRIGISSGPVIGSVVGVQKYVYDIFGPGVNLAARVSDLARGQQMLRCPVARRR